jgi:para-nitrobenzyl esterase
MKSLLFVAVAVILLSGMLINGCTKETPSSPTSMSSTIPAKTTTPVPTTPPAASLADPVKTDNGLVTGALIGETGKEVRIFKGIPYAAPPVGDLRWKPPQPAAPWTGVRECTTFSKSAPQSANVTDEATQSEDCLYLNVLTPARMNNEKLPVMVYMHGGAYSQLSGNDPTVNNYRLPGYGVIVVNVDMRLGPIGLFTHPLLAKESAKGVSGNYMFLDMIASLQWVQRNIAAFGGDPANVTIFGESGGGSKVATLIATPLAKGLFAKAICESGTCIADTWWTGKTNAYMEELGQRFFTILGVDKEPDPLKAARALPWYKIIEANNKLNLDTTIPKFGIVDATIDGWVLPDFPVNLYKEGKQNPVPLITCCNLGELGTLFPTLVPGYVDMQTANSKVGQKGYVMIFDQVPSKWRAEGVVSAHQMELMYVFGDMNTKNLFWQIMVFLARPKQPDPGLTEIDTKVSEMMMSMWSQFAKTGNPSAQGLIAWPVYDTATDQYMYVRDGLEVKSGFSKVLQK